MKMTLTERYHFITRIAEYERTEWPLKDRVAFHYFNPNGLYARKRRNDAAVVSLIEATGIPNGCLFTVGGLSNYEADRLRELFGKKRVNRIRFQTVLSMLRDHVEKQERFIHERVREHFPEHFEGELDILEERAAGC